MWRFQPNLWILDTFEITKTNIIEVGTWNIKNAKFLCTKSSAELFNIFIESTSINLLKVAQKRSLTVKRGRRKTTTLLAFLCMHKKCLMPRRDCYKNSKNCSSAPLFSQVASTDACSVSRRI